ncbi:MAG: shikimate dehydrogenase family protein [bacterium]
MKVSTEVRLVGILGYPIKHTLVTVIHNTSFKKLGLNNLCLPFEVPHAMLENAVRGLRGLNFLGAGVTVPHETEIMKYLDDIGEDARAIGSVTTIKNDGGKLIGYNTEGVGFYKSLFHDGGELPRGKTIFIFGSGSVARAIAFKVAMEKARRIYIVSRTFNSSMNLVLDLQKLGAGGEAKAVNLEPREMYEHMLNTDIFINATSLGANDEEIPFIVGDWFRNREMLVCDTVYTRKTPLLTLAERLGLRTLGGAGMLAYREAAAFELWTGIKAPVRLMRRVLEMKLEKG